MRTWTRSGADAEEFRFSEVLSALSFALDLVEGQPEGHTVRSCLVGIRIADRLGLDEERRSALVEDLLAEAEDGLWEDLLRKDPWQEVSRLEPDDRALQATPERVDLAARAFAEIIDAKSPFTYRHSEGVARVAVAMAERAGLGPEGIRDLMRAALLHDIGKLGVSNRILDKPGGLTNGEYEEIKRHPKLTYDILSRVGPFRPIAETAANHHEKLDGSGYHRGIGAEDLDLPSRILAVADIYDALSADRPYHEAMPQEEGARHPARGERHQDRPPMRRHPRRSGH